MDKGKLKEDLKNLVSENKIKEAINALRKYLYEQKSVNQILLLAGRHSRLTEAIRMDKIQLDNAQIEENKIMYALLEIIDEADFDVNKIIDPSSREKILDILSLCYKRAIFTRLHAQLSEVAMVESLIDTRVQLQKRVIRIEPKEARSFVIQIISEIDYIERMWNGSFGDNWHKINPAKLRIMASLISLSNIIDYEFELPQSFSENEFFTIDEANLEP